MWQKARLTIVLELVHLDDKGKMTFTLERLRYEIIIRPRLTATTNRHAPTRSGALSSKILLRTAIAGSVATFNNYESKYMIEFIST